MDREDTEDLTGIIKKEENIETLGNTFINTDDDFIKLVRKRDYKDLEEVPSKKNKRKLKKWVYLVLVGVILLIGLITFFILHNKKLAEDKKNLITEIKSHYSEYVKVDKDTPIYTYKSNEYKKIGTVYKNAILKLEEEKLIDENTKYFHVKDSVVNDYYIPYDTVSKSSKQETNSRYKHYLPFDKAVVASNYTLYLNGEKLIGFEEETEFPIIINDDNGMYYVEYNDMLVGIKKEEVKELQDYKIGEGKKNKSYVTTYAYHRVYEENDKCTDLYLCISKNDFDTQMKYLSDNNYLTLTLNEMYLYLQGKLHVEKAVVITMDDGYLYKAAEEVLRKYNLNGTLFVITGDFADFAPFKELTNFEVQSHTNNLHRNYVCSGGNQGGAILCASQDKIKEDLESSNKKLGVEPIGIAFPFYDYNDNAIKALKAVGYKMSFIGRAGQLGRAKPGVTDLYKIPRMTVYAAKEMSFNEWKSYL